MVRIWNQACDSAKQRERLDLEVRGGRYDIRLVQGNIRVVLLVDVQILNQTLTEEVIEG